MVLKINLSYATDCFTVSDNTWSCGTPDPSDNLTIDHNVTISSDFDLTGTITINNGGYLYITGNVVSSGGTFIIHDGGKLSVDGNLRLEDNSSLMNYGNVHTDNDLRLQNSTLLLLNGTFTVDGNITIDNLSSFSVESGAYGTFDGNFTNESTNVVIDGTIGITGNFTNNGMIEGIGVINYGGGCDGNGTINGIDSYDYCISASIDLQAISCTAIDNVPPEITSFPLNQHVYLLDNSCEISVYWNPPTFTDDCELDKVTSSHHPGDIFQIGTTSVTYFALDKAGNSSDSSFSITVLDNNAPTFTFCPSTFNIESVDTLSKTSVITWELPVAEDACNNIVLSSNYVPGDVFDFGITQVEYTANDQSGNVAKCVFDVTSGENRPPVSYDRTISANQGESIDVFIEAFDPDGNKVFLASITHNENNGIISNLYKKNLSFTYTSFEDFYGYDTLHIKLVDNGIPAASTAIIVVIDVESTTRLEISGALTPNGDQINDSWYIKDIDLFPDNSVTIFDRWGGLLFQTVGYNNTTVLWNGTSNRGNKRPVPTGTYIYIIDLGTGARKITGTVELLR